MAISRSQLTKELEPGLNALFGLEYGRYDQEHAEIFDTESSDRAFEEEVMLSGFGNAESKAESKELEVSFQIAEKARKLNEFILTKWKFPTHDISEI